MMQKNPADFKAYRDFCGLTQQNIADLLGKSIKVIKQYEDGKIEIPDEAWEIIDTAMQKRDSAMETAFHLIDDIEKNKAADPKSITLTYWRDQLEYNQHGRDKGFYNQVNANARAVADVLRNVGFNIEFHYFDDGAISTPGSNY